MLRSFQALLTRSLRSVDLLGTLSGAISLVPKTPFFGTLKRVSLRVDILSADFDRTLWFYSRMLCYKRDIAKSTGRVGAGVPAVFLVGSLVLER